jgi:hypothetical protein
MMLRTFILGLVCLVTQAFAADVTLTQDERGFVLKNGIVTARIEKRSGNLTSMTFGGVDLLQSGRGYWSFVGSGSRLGSRTSTEVRQDPEANGGQRAEVLCRFEFEAETGGLPCNVDLGYSLGGIKAASTRTRS